MFTNRTAKDVLNPDPSKNDKNCPSSHGLKGFHHKTVYDNSLGAYICACGRQYLSDLERPDDMKVINSYEKENTPIDTKE